MFPSKILYKKKQYKEKEDTNHHIDTNQQSPSSPHLRPFGRPSNARKRSSSPERLLSSGCCRCASVAKIELRNLVEVQPEERETRGGPWVGKKMRKKDKNIGKWHKP
jgi:hypothetical protein